MDIAWDTEGKGSMANGPCIETRLFRKCFCHALATILGHNFMTEDV